MHVSIKLSGYDGLCCPYCERKMLLGDPKLTPTRDHVIPRVRGGRQTIVCCRQCNGFKGEMMPDEWQAWRLDNPCYWLWTPAERRRATGKKPYRKRVRHVSQVVVPPELIYADRRLRYRCGEDGPNRMLAEKLISVLDSSGG